MQQISRTVIINASPAAVWDALTIPSLMKQWMAEPEMKLEIVTEWTVGSPIVIRGFHHIAIENKGIILHFEPNRALAYTHLSSLSRLPDEPESYTHFQFQLAPVEDQTLLTLTLSNFPTEPIFRHVDFYWKVAIEQMRKMVEKKL